MISQAILVRVFFDAQGNAYTDASFQAPGNPLPSSDSLALGGDNAGFYIHPYPLYDHKHARAVPLLQYGTGSPSTSSKVGPCLARPSGSFALSRLFPACRSFGTLVWSPSSPKARDLAQSHTSRDKQSSFDTADPRPYHKTPGP